MRAGGEDDAEPSGHCVERMQMQKETSWGRS